MSKQWPDCRISAGVLTFTLLATLVGGLLPVSAIEYGGIGGRPANPRADNPRTESIFIHTLEPGSEQSDGVMLVNNASEKKTLLVYAVDSVVSSGGAFACRQMSEEKKSVGAWLALDKDEVVLNPGASEVIDFLIKVPQDAAVGEHNGCIVIQEKKDIADQAGVNLSFRTGLRVAISIPGETVRKLEISALSIDRQDDGTIIIKPAVKNLGNVSIDADVKLVTKNIFGLKYQEQGGEFPILRGETAEWNFEMEKPFWGGWYKTELTVAYQEDGGTEIGKETAGAAYTSLGEKSGLFFVAPSLIALLIEIIILIGIVVLILLLLAAKKRRSWIKGSWQESEVADGEDLMALAQKLSVSWRLLANVNKLKAPYILKAGQKIKVPPLK